MDARFIDDLARKLSDGLPAGMRSLQQDLESNFKAVLRSALGKLDLVTREEFEVQSAVLARTRDRLKEFEARIAAMESAAKAPATSSPKKRASTRTVSKKSGKSSKKKTAGKTGKRK